MFIQSHYIQRSLLVDAVTLLLGHLFAKIFIEGQFELSVVLAKPPVGECFSDIADNNSVLINC